MNSIKTELKKAICSPTFLAALILGIALCIMDLVQTVPVVLELDRGQQAYIDMNLPVSTGAANISLFPNWMGVNRYNLGGRIFVVVWPVLAAVPFGWSAAQDRISGYYNQLVSRCGMRQYFWGKYIASFVSGGLAVCAPLVLNLLALAMVCPDCVCPVDYLSTSIGNGYFLAKQFYTQPWLFCAGICAMDFLWGGAAACLCLTLGAFMRRSYMVMLFPFALLYVANAILDALDSVFSFYYTLSPLQLISADPNSPNPWWVIFPEIFALLGISALVGYEQVKKHELV